jgi:hypothetical protein
MICCTLVVHLYAIKDRRNAALVRAAAIGSWSWRPKSSWNTAAGNAIVAFHRSIRIQPWSVLNRYCSCARTHRSIRLRFVLAKPKF